MPGAIWSRYEPANRRRTVKSLAATEGHQGRRQPINRPPWQSRPDFLPEKPLVNFNDFHLDLEDLDQKSKGKRKVSGPMPESQKQAISDGLKEKGAKDLEHRRRIARGMREAHAKNPNLRRAGAGVSKKCGICGEFGHNARTCPERDTREEKEKTRKKKRGKERKSGDDIGAVSDGQMGGGTQLEHYSEDGSERKGQSASPFSTLKKPDGEGIALLTQIPSTPEACALQAAASVLLAWNDGIRRQKLELLIPQKSSGMDGWPGGIRQQFRQILPLITSVLQVIKQNKDLEGRITPEWIDEGDCVAAWQSERLAAVVFPTGEALQDIRRIDDALSGRRLMLVMNAQWQPRGQVISDFGVGAKRKKAEDFVASFEDTYHLSRVGVFGDDVRILRAYPGPWQVYFMSKDKKPKLLTCDVKQPTYERILDLLKAVPGSRASKTWFDRAMSVGLFNSADSYDGLDSDDFSIVEWDKTRDIVTGELID